MSQIEIIITLSEKVFEDANSFGILKNDELLRLINSEIERRNQEVDDEIEAALHLEDFAEFFSEDGTVDFARLDATTEEVTLESLFSDQS